MREEMPQGGQKKRAELASFPIRSPKVLFPKELDEEGLDQVLGIVG
jgi:hypothetical protein